MEDIKVSIVIPICNTGKYLKDTLTSVVNQTLKEIEIICVDDFSQDNCREIIEQFKAKDSRIIPIYHTTNLSTSQARKDGALASKGKYVMFLDGDDELALNACEIAYKAIEDTGVDMVHFGTEIVNCANFPQDRIEINQRLVASYLGEIRSKSIVFDCWRDKKFGFQIWNKIYQGKLVRKAFQEIEDGSFPKAQDLYAFFVMAYYAQSYYGIEEQLYKYKFGLGSSGGNKMTLDKYRVMLTEVRVAEALGKFIANKQEKEELQPLVATLYEGFLSECFNKWHSNLFEKDKKAAWKSFCEEFSFDEILLFLAKKYWYNKTDILKLFSEQVYLNYQPREGKKVKTIAAYYRCISNGGAQRVVAMLCNQWAELVDEAGNPLYEVVLIIDEGHEDEVEYELNAKVKRAYLPDFKESVGVKYRDRFLSWKKILEQYDIDIVVTSLGLAPCTMWDMLTVKGCSPHTAFCIHSHSLASFIYGSASSEAIDTTYKYRICDGVVTLSECDKLYAESFNSNVKAIANPLSFDIAVTPVSSYKKNTITWCGRISPEKQPLDLVKIMELVVKEIPDAKLYIVGEGNEGLTEKMRTQIEELNLTENIELVGFTLEVDKYYKQSSALLVTSAYEGFSLTIAEALSHSVPIISYDLPYLTFMQDGRGILTVPQGKYDLMAEKLISLLKNKESIVELGKAAKLNVANVCGSDIANQWKNFFDRVEEKYASENRNEEFGLVIDSIVHFHENGRLQYAKKCKQLENKLKAANKKMQSTNTALQKNEKELSDIKSGLSFKIGRLITWLPRKIFGKK